MIEYDVSGTSFTFNRSIGTGAGNINWTSNPGYAAATNAGSGGFSAFAGAGNGNGNTLTVNLNAGSTLYWNDQASTGAQLFVSDGYALRFGSLKSNATVTFQNNIALDGSSASEGANATNTVAFNRTREINVTRGVGNSADFTNLTGTISGTINTDLVKTGAGTLALSNLNTYAGNTLLQGGSIVLNNSSGLGAGTLNIGTGANTGATGTIFNSATLGINLTTAVTLSNNVVLPAPVVASTSSFVKAAVSASTGTLLNFTGNILGGNANLTWHLNTDTSNDNSTTFQFSGVNTFRAGTINLNRGRIFVNNVNGLGDPANTVRLDSTVNNTTGNLSFLVSGTFGNPIMITSAGAYPIGVTGANTVTLTSPITYSSTLVKVDTGTLISTATNVGSANSININAGTLQFGNGGSGGTLGTTGSVSILAGATLGVNLSSNLTITNDITGGGALTKSGTGALTLSSSANTYTGATQVFAGTLFANNTTGSATGAGVVTVNSAATLGGSGTVTPNTGNTATNTVTINGTVSPGAAAVTVGTLTIGSLSANATLTASNAYTFELTAAGSTATASTDGSSANATHDRFTVNGALNATNLVVNINSIGSTGFDNSLSYSWVIASTTNGLTGTPTLGIVTGTDFSSLNGGAFSVTTDTNNLYLNFTPVPEPILVFALTSVLGVIATRRRLFSI